MFNCPRILTRSREAFATGWTTASPFGGGDVVEECGGGNAVEEEAASSLNVVVGQASSSTKGNDKVAGGGDSDWGAGEGISSTRGISSASSSSSKRRGESQGCGDSHLGLGTGGDSPSFQQIRSSSQPFCGMVPGSRTARSALMMQSASLMNPPGTGLRSTSMSSKLPVWATTSSQMCKDWKPNDQPSS